MIKRENRKAIIISGIKFLRGVCAQKKTDIDFINNPRLRDCLREELEERKQTLKKHEQEYMTLVYEEFDRLFQKAKELEARIQAQHHYDLDLEEQFNHTKFLITEVRKEIDQMGFRIEISINN